MVLTLLLYRYPAGSSQLINDAALFDRERAFHFFKHLRSTMSFSQHDVLFFPTNGNYFHKR